ncbi:RfaL Lipid A core - O-antigen ligase and related enzymes [Candidatus Nanopelagicaceae bacterium]
MKVQQKAVLLSGIAYIAIALFHIPDGIFRHGFDKNAPAQLFSLLIVAAGYSIFIAVKSERFRFTKLAQYGAVALIATQLASLLMSGSLISSLIGDTGRYVGSISTFALLAISIFHTQFNFRAFLTLTRFYLAAIEFVALAGVAQHFNLIELPGDQGMSATLGNIDFFAAFIGTSLPLIFLLALYSSRRGRVIALSAALFNIYALYLAGPLQGYLDIAFVVVGVLLFTVRKYIPRPQWSLNARTYIGTFAVVIWAEFIFLMPFLGAFIPVLGNDAQVKIRSNFWLAGTRQFFSHPLLGVGPDQYGNNYEQYRTLEDIAKYTNILSNDAHSASVQTLATVGILGTLTFLFLIALVIRSLLILWDSRSIDRKSLFAIGLYIFVYLTNSFVSPITLAHKYLFWAVCGFVIGQVYRLPSRKSEKSSTSKALPLLSAGVLALVATLFAQGQINYLTHIEKYAADNSVVLDYTPSPLLPCFMFFDAEILMAKNVGVERASEVAHEELANNPRCVAAQIYITERAVNSGDLNGLGALVYHLYEIAPARNQTISLAMYYANRAGDTKLRTALEKEMKSLGLVYIPGKLG